MPNEISVYLVVAGFDRDPDEITSATGVQPTDIWRKGDQIGPTIRRHEDNGWRLASGADGLADLNEQVNALAARVEPFSGVLPEVAHGAYLEIACVIRAYDSVPAMHLERSTLQRIASLGADLDIDLYYLVEEEED